MSDSFHQILLKKFNVHYSDSNYESYAKKYVQYTFDKSSWSGSVLLLLAREQLFFIKRSEQMPSHRGQLAFLGGNRKKNENSPKEVLLREYEEETGLSSQEIHFLGDLPPVFTGSDQLIIPSIGLIEQSTIEYLKRLKSNGEWEFGFFLKFSDLCREESWRYAWRYGAGSDGALLFRSVLPHEPEFIGSYTSRRVWPLTLWGATARMVWNFVQIYKSDPLQSLNS